MSRRSAFDEAFCDPVTFWDGQVVLDARINSTDTEQLLVDDYGVFLIDDRYARHHIRENLQFAWVKFHAGQNEDGEPCNTWWLYEKFTPGRKGMKPVHVYWPDRHYAQHGHMYHPQINEQGYRETNDKCLICKQLNERGDSERAEELAG